MLCPYGPPASRIPKRAAQQAGAMPFHNHRRRERKKKRNPVNARDKFSDNERTLEKKRSTGVRKKSGSTMLRGTPENSHVVIPVPVPKNPFKSNQFRANLLLGDFKLDSAHLPRGVRQSGLGAAAHLFRRPEDCQSQKAGRRRPQQPAQHTANTN